MQVQEGVTHVLINYRKENQTQLYRAKSGMLIGIRVGQVVKYGPNPLNGEQRMFVNDQSAIEYLKDTVARFDLPECGVTADEPIFEERDGEPLIVEPNAPNRQQTRPPEPHFRH